MGVPFNELNRVLALGFKTLPQGDTCSLPTTLQPVGRAVPSAPAPATNAITISLPRQRQPPAPKPELPPSPSSSPTESPRLPSTAARPQPSDDPIELASQVIEALRCVKPAYFFVPQ